MTTEARSEADVPDLTDQMVVVTGASAGMGAELATPVARCNTDVVLAVRDENKG